MSDADTKGQMLNLRAMVSVEGGGNTRMEELGGGCSRDAPDELRERRRQRRRLARGGGERGRRRRRWREERGSRLGTQTGNLALAKLDQHFYLIRLTQTERPRRLQSPLLPPPFIVSSTIARCRHERAFRLLSTSAQYSGSSHPIFLAHSISRRPGQRLN